MQLTHRTAQAIMLAAQGLLEPPARAATKDDVLATIRRMSVLQIDTIHVVARSPYFVLWSRLGMYEPRWLDELLAEGALFEYWSHEASFLPIEDYGLYRRHMLDELRRWGSSSRTWFAEQQDEVIRLLAQIREHGPVRSSDFVRSDGQAGTWWNWKPEKRILEMLHTSGELMIARRHNFQRIYDLRERVLPAWDDMQAPSTAEVKRKLVIKAVRALGITQARWVPDYFRTPKQGSAALLESLADQGELMRVAVAGWSDQAYVHRDNLPLVQAGLAGMLVPTVTTLLSPFDPIVWDRSRALAVWGFDYRIECYTPAPKRRYGYFSLPILHRGDLVGRLDAKAHRSEGHFEVKALYLEPGVPVTDELISDLSGALGRCASWHKTPTVEVQRSEPEELAGLLNALAPQAAAC